MSVASTNQVLTYNYIDVYTLNGRFIPRDKHAIREHIHSWHKWHIKHKVWIKYDRNYENYQIEDIYVLYALENLMVLVFRGMLSHYNNVSG